LLQRYESRLNEERRVKSYWKSRDTFAEKHGAVLEFFDRLLDPFSDMPSGWVALFALGGMATDARSQDLDIDAVKEAVVAQRVQAEIDRVRDLKGAGLEWPEDLNPTLQTGDQGADLAGMHRASILKEKIQKSDGLTRVEREWLIAQLKGSRDYNPDAGEILASGTPDPKAAKSGPAALNFSVELSNQGGTIEIRGYELLDRGQPVKTERPGPLSHDSYHRLDASFDPKTGKLTIDMYQTTQPFRGIGTEMISRAMDAVGAAKVRTLSGDLALDNLSRYNAEIKGGATPEAAAAATPLGKSATKLGFSKVAVQDITLPNGKTRPRATFSKE
jgi:hypothetical protein